MHFLQSRADMLDELRCRQEAIDLLRRALDPFAIANTKIGRPLKPEDYNLAQTAMQKTTV